MINRFKKWKVPLLVVAKKHGILFWVPFLKLFTFAVIRNIRWVWIRYISRTRVLEIEVLGSKMFVDIGKTRLDIGEESVEKQLVMDCIREPRATEVFRKVLKPGDVVLDIGANIGYYALLAAQIIGETGKVYALEPSPSSITLLRKSVEANGLEHIVEINEKAVASTVGAVQFFTSDWSNLSTTYNSRLVTGKQIPFGRSIEVEATTVDAFLEGKRTPSLIKMDIEGAEVDVIKGMLETLACSERMTLFIEIHPQLLDDTSLMQDFLGTLMENGFDTLAVISHDDFYRNAVGIGATEHMSISELISDRRVVEGTTAFEAFFVKPSNRK